MLKENSGCFVGIGVYVIIIATIMLGFNIFDTWKKRHPVNYCDEINNEKIKDYNPVVCKLRYPILNMEDIKKVKKENEELKEEISDLKSKLDDIKDVFENGKEDNWEPDPIQPDY